MLKIEHLTKAFGDKLAVDDLSLHIAPGEIYGFIGHNGAGKTTTLRSVAGIQQFDKGEIFIAGHSVRTEPLECKRALAYIPDNPDLYDFMSGIKYLNFIADIFGVGADERAERIRRPGRGVCADGRSGAAHRRLFPRHEAEACDHLRMAARAEAHPHGRTVRRSRPEGRAHSQGHDARALRCRRRDLLLHACARSRGKALRQGRHHHAAASSSAPVRWMRYAATTRSKRCSLSWRKTRNDKNSPPQAARRDLPHVFVRCEEEQGALQRHGHRLLCPVRAPHGRAARRHVHLLWRSRCAARS